MAGAILLRSNLTDLFSWAAFHPFQSLDELYWCWVRYWCSCF